MVRLFKTLCHDGDGAIVWLDQIAWVPMMLLCSGHFAIWKGLDFFASLPEGVLGFPFSGSIPMVSILAVCRRVIRLDKCHCERFLSKDDLYSRKASRRDYWKRLNRTS